MDLADIADKLAAQPWEGHTITSVEHSRAEDFSFVEQITADPFMAAFDWVEWMRHVPPFLRVCVTVEAAPGSQFEFEVWLPVDDWNGRVVTIGNGGPAMGLIPPGLIAATQENYAAIHGNLGTGPDLDRGVDTPAVWADFGWRATHLMTVIGKQIVEIVYGAKPQYSYFYGCSTGGQQGVSAAENTPGDFDGIAALVPAIGRTYLHVYTLWNAVNLLREDGSTVFSDDEVQRLAGITRGFFRARGDGAPSDEFVSNPHLGEGDSEEVLRLVGATGEFTGEQLNALLNVYRGPVNPRTEERIFCGLPVGGECHPLGLNYVAAPGYNVTSFYPVRWGLGVKYADHDWRSFDFDADVDSLRKLTRDLNADTAELDAFRAHGGKMIMASGAMDTVCPEPTITNYYERVLAKQGGLARAQDFFRYFIVPGMHHGSRGSADGFDFLGPADAEIPATAKFGMLWQGLFHAVVDWVENGSAPDVMMATGFNRTDTSPLFFGDPASGIRSQRPVYPYPDATAYLGGDPTRPTSFARSDGGLHNPPERAERYWPR